MPKPPAEAFREALEQHRKSSEPRQLYQTLNGCLNMSNAHRDVPSVEDMFHLPVHTGSAEAECPNCGGFRFLERISKEN